MSCCNSNIKHEDTIDKVIHLSVLQAKTRASICLTCPNNHQLQQCKKDGKSLFFKAMGHDNCPLNKFPDQYGRVKAWGLTWKGVSYIDRIRIASPRFRKRFVKYGLKSTPEPLPYCGCSILIKSWWLWTVSKLEPSEFRSELRQFPTKMMAKFLNWMYSQYPKNKQ